MQTVGLFLQGQAGHRIIIQVSSRRSVWKARSHGVVLQGFLGHLPAIPGQSRVSYR
jgi:hypothetical protein